MGVKLLHIFLGWAIVVVAGCKHVQCRFASIDEIKRYSVCRSRLDEWFSPDERQRPFVCHAFMEYPHSVYCWIANSSRTDYFVSIGAEGASLAIRYLDKKGKCVDRHMPVGNTCTLCQLSLLQGQQWDVFVPHDWCSKKWTVDLPQDCCVLLNMSIEFSYVTYQDVGRCRSGKDMEMLLEKNKCRVAAELMN